MSLLECLAAVPDPRRRHGIRHRAAVVLAFAVAAVMAGADSVAAIAEWACDVPAEVLGALSARRDRRGRPVSPSLSTFRRVLRKLDGRALAAAFGTWLAAQVLAGLADAGALVIALDGKTVRGAKAGNKKAPHLLAAMITGARAVIVQKDVDAKTNEITQVRPLLDDIDITGHWSPRMPCTCRRTPPATWLRTSTRTTCSPQSRTTSRPCSPRSTPWTGRARPSRT